VDVDRPERRVERPVHEGEREDDVPGHEVPGAAEQPPREPRRLVDVQQPDDEHDRRHDERQHGEKLHDAPDARIAKVHPVDGGDEDQEADRNSEERELERLPERVAELRIFEDELVGGEAVALDLLQAELRRGRKGHQEVESRQADPEPAGASEPPRHAPFLHRDARRSSRK
jgi:hypothetical protein